jgi:hypothetical protein
MRSGYGTNTPWASYSHCSRKEPPHARPGMEECAPTCAHRARVVACPQGQNGGATHATLLTGKSVGSRARQTKARLAHAEKCAGCPPPRAILPCVALARLAFVGGTVIPLALLRTTALIARPVRAFGYLPRGPRFEPVWGHFTRPAPRQRGRTRGGACTHMLQGVFGWTRAAPNVDTLTAASPLCAAPAGAGPGPLGRHCQAAAAQAR